MSEDSREMTLNKAIVRHARRCVVALLILLFGSMPAMAAQTLDFSAVTSKAQAEQLVREGKLVRILLFPAQFGGEDSPENSTYVPPAIVDALALVEGTIGRIVREGTADKLDVVPEYHGRSFVPARIRMHVTRAGEAGGFHPVVEIW